MKFAKELERDCVPEWRAKYVDYKQGKKKLKAVGRALKNVNQTPRPHHRGTNTFTPSPFDTAPKYSFLNRNHGRRSGEAVAQDLRSLALQNSSQSNVQNRANGNTPSQPKNISKSHEERPLRNGQDEAFPGMTRYGSIIGSPSRNELHGIKNLSDRDPTDLELPDPALDPDHSSIKNGSPSGPARGKDSGSKLGNTHSNTGNAFEVGKTRAPRRHASGLPPKYRSIFSPKRMNSMPGPDTSRPLYKRMFSIGGDGIRTPQSDPSDVALEAYRDLDFRQAEFFNFMDKQLDTVETFYRQKEEEATERLEVLREQLHIMRDRRLDELITIRAAKIKAKESKKAAADRATNGNSSSGEDSRPDSRAHLLGGKWLKPIDDALEAVRSGRYGKTTKAMESLATPSALRPMQPNDNHRDYSRRPETPDVPYRTAKRKLKTALQEYYRGLELLKSYALLNRTAFRKINKKYDKTVNARPSGRYMAEKVNKAWFVKSETIDGHIRVVEDLYARYFEEGNHKVAVGKLRVKMARAGDFTEHSFRNGLMLAAGMVFGIQGLTYGVELVFSPDPQLAIDTSFLLQIYAGYFLINFLFILFALACRVWQKSKINYVFIFEYDTRHHLDWRQLCELPCLFIFLLGLIVWLNFTRYGSNALYLYYPVILVGITILIICFPAPIIYHRSRKWLLYSTWRLALAGLYPVEFRDFYLGDMFCSLTYSMGNIELFFCLYANYWANPNQCNSTHSRLMGFFSTLPGIWRALQCIRRYYDTRNIFPHLVNCGKYSATITFYLTLSIYRIQQTHHHWAIFITFATINSIYCSIWDVIMDWSLGDPYARHPYLRETLGYKRVWAYYVAMVLDPILRFNWIFYAIYPVEIQHSAILSFAVAMSEACRRGMWTLFRVENEHCTNVGRFRASRDIPLPYEMPSTTTTPSTRSPEILHQQSHTEDGANAAASLRHTITQSTPGLASQTSQAQTTSTDLEAATRTPTLSHRRRRAAMTETPSPLTRGLTRVGTILHAAHAQDFERKKKPELGGKAESEPEDSDDEEEEEDAKSDPSEDEEDGEDLADIGEVESARRAAGQGGE